MGNPKGTTTGTTRAQAIDFATKIATWATIFILAFFFNTLLSLDKTSGIMNQRIEIGFAVVKEKLTRIELGQDALRALTARQESRLVGAEAQIAALREELERVRAQIAALRKQ